MKKTMTKAVFILTLICGLITFICLMFSYILPLFLSHRYDMGVKNANTAGVIGGADGPTSVFVSGGSSFCWFAAAFAVLTLLGIIFLIINKKNNKD